MFKPIPANRRARVTHCLNPKAVQSLRTAVEALELRRLLSSTVGFNGTPYTQNFDGLMNTGTVTPSTGTTDLSQSPYSRTSGTLDGWAFFTPTGNTPRFLVSDGSGGTGSTGAVFSYGASGSSERALGSLASGANISKIGVTLVNNTASTISSFTVTFDGEIWHRGDQATTVNKLAFDYEIGTGAALGDAGVYTPVPQLNVNVPSTATGTNTAVDGNAAANRTAGVTYTFSGVSWGAGQNLVLRWSDANEGGNDDGLSVDNFRLALPSVAGTVGFSNPTYDVNENDGVATISVQRTSGMDGAVDVTYDASAGTATAGDDFTPATGTLHWNDQESGIKTFTVPITNDNVPENSETVNLTLSNPTGGAVLGQTTATLTIHDDDGVVPTGLLLNEVNVNPPSSPDNPYEYWELKGAAGGSLNNVFLVSIEGDGGSNPGAATAVFDLSGNALGSNGLAWVRSSNNSGFAPDPGTTVIDNALLDTAGGILQNGANSFMVIYNNQSPIVSGADLDTDNDGTLDLPAGSVVLDGVGWTTGTTGDRAYGAVLPALAVGGGQITTAATRDPNNTAALSAGAWFAGVVAGGFPAATTYDVSRSTLNTPAGEVLTPGAANSTGDGPNGGAFAFGPVIYNVSENAGTITIPVYRFGGSLGAVSVDYNGSDGSAQSGSDYTNASGTLNFADGQTSANLVITIVNDNVAEFPENFTVSLSNATNGSSIGPRPTATVNIDDDDVVAPSAVLLNELSVDPPGTDQPNEYLEIKATPGSVLNKVYVISVEGDSEAGIGSADQVFNLTGITVGSNGLIMIRGTNGFGTEDGNTTIVTSTIFDTNGAGLENGSNSFLVVFSPTTIAKGSDLDTNDDGTLDLPSGATVLDGVGWLDGGGGDFSYGATLSLTAPATNPPGAASRFRSNTDANSASAWFFGKLSNTNGPGFDYNPAQSSANLPSGAKLTPGAENYAVTDTTPPTVTGTFDFDAARQQITLQFSEPVQDITTADINLTQLPVTTIPPENIIITHPQPDQIVLQFQNYPFNALPDGNYNLLLHKDNVKDLAGNALASDFSMGFFSYEADANRDMKVNALDFNALATNFGSSGPFSKGDFNYDGTVNTLDFNALASRFNQTLPLLPAAPLGLASLFSAEAVGDKGGLSDLLN